MIAALFAAAAVYAHPPAQISVAIGELIGLTPAEVAARLHLKAGVETAIAGVGEVGGHRVVVTSPQQWAHDTANVCPSGRMSMVHAPADFSGSTFSPRLVFVDGRLARVKRTDPDALEDALDTHNDIDADQQVAVLCQYGGEQYTPAQQAVGAVVLGLPLLPFIATRAVVVGGRQGEGVSLLSSFRLGAEAGDLDRLRAEHPDAIRIADQGQGRRIVRIRYGKDQLGAQNGIESALDDLYVDVLDGRVVGLWRGLTVRANCRFGEDSALRCG